MTPFQHCLCRRREQQIRLGTIIVATTLVSFSACALIAAFNLPLRRPSRALSIEGHRFVPTHSYGAAVYVVDKACVSLTWFDSERPTLLPPCTAHEQHTPVVFIHDTPCKVGPIVVARKPHLLENGGELPRLLQDPLATGIKALGEVTILALGV